MKCLFSEKYFWKEENLNRNVFLRLTANSFDEMIERVKGENSMNVELSKQNFG